ncbi:Chaperone binding protein [Entamoeba marina]
MSMRYDWYQLKDHVVIDVFEKNVPKDKVSITFEDEQVTIEVTKDEQQKTLIVDNLYGEYLPNESSFFVGRAKIEIKLKKKDNSNWENLTKDKIEHHPVTSTQLFRKDWDQVDKNLEEELKDDDKDGGPNQMFQQLYANATDEQRRAMNKSFIESNGTSLSMNWNEVGSKPVEGSAPEGAIMKKWGDD